MRPPLAVRVGRHSPVGQDALLADVFSAFAADLAATPTISLRAGNELDDYKQASRFEPAADAISDAYLESYHWGIAHLDAASWRHYLPYLIEYALRHRDNGSLVVDSLLHSLRPPDREPPRLASLSCRQESLITQFLETLAFGESSVHQDLACQVLDEWWLPNALYRAAAKSRPAPPSS